MGTPKALLCWKGEPLVRRVATALRDGGCERVLIVVGPGETGREIAGAVGGLSGVEISVNPEPERGMLSSVQIGLSVLERNAFLVCPCDLPGLSAEHVRSVVAGWDGEGDGIVAPTRAGQRGHPTLFGPELVAAAQSLNPAQFGLNQLLRMRAVTEVNVDDDGPFRDADTPAAWSALLEQEQ